LVNGGGLLGSLMSVQCAWHWVSLPQFWEHGVVL
jgi:hypothetical protein